MKYKPKTYYIKTYGCQANVADSGTIAGILEVLGFERVASKGNYRNDREELTDVLPRTELFIINTCSVRQKSEDKVYGLGKVLKLVEDQNSGKKPFVLISGCLVGSVKGKRKRFKFSELKKKTKWADDYSSPSEIFDLPNILLRNGMLGGWAMKKFDPESVVSIQKKKKHAYVNVSSGCDNFCTFCVVPYARGKETSRSEKEILSEIKRLVSQGYAEFTLCGQNVNSWGLSVREKFNIRAGDDQELPFADLMRKVHKMKGVKKIEFISSNPFDFTQDLIEVLKLPKISNYLHIAVQAGNNEILKKMNRRHTIEEFMDLVEKIRQVRPGIELGTDIIVGFPGETREQFMDTVDLFKKVRFKVAFISMYSPRKGTIAEKQYQDDVPSEEKKWRHGYLTSVWRSTRD